MSIFDGLSLDVSKLIGVLKQQVAHLTDHTTMVTAAAETYKEKYEAAAAQVVDLQAQVASLQAQLPAPATIPAEFQLPPAIPQSVDPPTDTPVQEMPEAEISLTNSIADQLEAAGPGALPPAIPATGQAVSGLTDAPTN